MQTPSEHRRNSEFGIGSAPPRRSIFGNYHREDAGQASQPASDSGSQPPVGERPGQEGRPSGRQDACPTNTLQSSVDIALARSFAFRLLAKAFEDPDLDGWQWLASQSTKSALRSAATTLSEISEPVVKRLSRSDEENSPTPQTTLHEPKGRASSPLRADGCNHDFLRRKERRARSDAPYLDQAVPATDASPILEVEALRNLVNHLTLDAFDSFHTDYVTCFGHTVRGDCPMNEIEYGDIKADPLFQPHRLADLGAFYAAFGLEMTPDAAERQDHISIELEFMSVLAAKEAYALEHQFDDEQFVICRDAQKKFLREHLGRWTPGFTRRLARLAGDTALGALARFTGEFIAADCARFKVAAGSEDLLLRPIDDASEMLCASCGITNLPPGAMSSPVER